MRIIFLIFALTYLTVSSFSQEKTSETFLADSSLVHASVSLCVADAKSGDVIIDYNSGISLTPASILKLITSAAALELLGPEYTFKTTVGYTGSLNKRSGKLKGNIIIHGGGDPALGSKYFSDHYLDFIGSWVTEIKKLGIKRIKGRVITDDSYFISYLSLQNGCGKMKATIMAQEHMDCQYLTTLMNFILKPCPTVHYLFLKNLFRKNPGLNWLTF